MIRDVVSEIARNGGVPFFVGGYVRDRMLGLVPKDIDIEVYGILPENLKEILGNFGDVVECGESFGVYKLGNLDFAIPRKEKSTGRGHKTIDVDSDPFLDPKIACRRRDFTINAIMRNAITGEVLDFFGGKSDLKNGVIRAVDPSVFTDDPLRMLRAAKFAARFGFEIEQGTLQMMQKNRYYVRNLPIDRVFGEISDILMKGIKPSKGFRILEYTGILELMLPEISALQSIEQSEKWHPEGNVFNHTMLCIDYNGSRTLPLQLARLYHDTGKIFGSIGHAEKSAEIVRDTFPKDLTNNKEIIEEVANIVAHHMIFYGGSVTRTRVKRIASKVNLPVLVEMVRSDKLTRPLPEEMLEEDRRHIDKFLEVYEEVQNEVAPIILGRDIQREFPEIKPGPIFKDILDAVYEEQLNDRFTDHETGICMLKEVVRRFKI